MEKPMNSSTSLPRTKSDQLVETLEAAYKSPVSSEATGALEGGGTLSRRSSRQRLLICASPGRSGTASGSSSSRKSTHNRKSKSAQLKPELDHEVLSSGAALCRASSASLGLSYSFTGFTIPPDEIADSKPFSDDDDDIPYTCRCIVEQVFKVIGGVFLLPQINSGPIITHVVASKVFGCNEDHLASKILPHKLRACSTITI